ncbi:MAG: DUF748 domain-containing protein [Proteobacteria bacterium]|nr:DUF748 domain-containing protein [Pseudomonadota bacterium]MBU1545283.1 DUF748 domain-containing protein [Pseudomonadota bacterium]MBU2620349.1 DUF748 domain-containing protein [Pseudomonadota bacterium]
MPKRIETTGQLFSLPPFWRRRLAILGIILAALFTLYGMAGFLLAPYLISRYAPQYAEEQLHSTLLLGKVRINPLLFTCDIQDLSLRTTDGDEPLFSAHRLFVDLELESILRRAWTFGNLVIESPSLHLKIDGNGRLNLADLLKKQPASAPPPDTEKPTPPRLLLQHLALSNGTVHLADHSTAQPIITAFTPIALELKNISTLPEHRGTYTVSASLPNNGTLGWQGDLSLQPLSSTGSIELKDFKPAAIWHLFQDGLNLAQPGGTAHLTAGYDFSAGNGKPELRINPIRLEVQGLSLAEKDTTEPLLNIKSFAASGGDIDFATRRISLPSIILKGGRFAPMVNAAGVGNWQRLVKETANPPGTITTAPVTTPPWRISLGSFDATGLTLQYNDASRATPISLEADLALSLSGGSLDLGRQEAVVKRLALRGGGITYTQNPLNREKSAQGNTRSESGPLPAGETGPEQKNPWKVAFNQIDISGFRLGFVDQKNTTPLAYGLTGLTAQVKDFASPADKPIAFEAQAEIDQGGSVNLSGTTAQSAGKLGQTEARIGISEMSLKPLAPLVTEHTALTLVSGNLSTNLHLLHATDGTKPSLSMEGEATIGKLLLNEEKTGARLLAWKELTASGLDFGLNPDRLTIKQIRLREPEIKITIFKDKSLNLAKIRKQRAETEEKKEDAGNPPFPVEIDRIRLNNGVVDFADLSLVLPFATRVEQFKGAATGISTKPASRASLKFEGRVGEFGQAKARGSLIPSNPRQFTDITVTFRNVAMMPLSPYSATFAGRSIASGKLNLDLGYNIKDSELLGENSVVLEDFILGERVESPSAMDLPLDLAIALLTDSAGKIDIAVPIRGNIDHPEFSYGHVIRQALFNLLGKIVTAPFRALGAMLGGSSENPGIILFEPGRAELAPPEQEKIKNLAEALAKREQLQLTVHGGFDPGLDGTAIKRSQLRRTLVQEFGTTPGPIAFDNAKTQRALEKLGEDTLAAFQSRYEETSGQKVKRVNPGLALLGKASEDSAFYRALFRHLVETAPLPQAELQALAEQRGLAIVQELASRFKGDPARIGIGPAVQTEEQEKGVPAKLELSAR